MTLRTYLNRSRDNPTLITRLDLRKQVDELRKVEHIPDDLEAAFQAVSFAPETLPDAEARWKALEQAVERYLG